MPLMKNHSTRQARFLPAALRWTVLPHAPNGFLAPLMCVLATAVAAQTPLPRKLIVTGWDNPDPAQFRRDCGAMEQWPFDGAVIHVQGVNAGGKPFEARAAFGTNHWEPLCFTNALADLQAARSDKLTDNFLLIGANPGNVDWFDDTGWAEIAEHWRLLARLARDGGMKGLLFDPEPYTEPFKQFCYSSQPAREAHSFEDYGRQARQRGREVMRAVVAEYPDVTILAYFLWSITWPAAAAGPQALAGHGYGLLPDFANGWLDVLPPGVTLVDGNEQAYRYNSEGAFQAAFVRIKHASLALVPGENRAKYRAQVQAGHGIYLDAHVNPSTSPWYIDGRGGPRVHRLEANVASALDAADEYVWIYGEKARWWPPRQPGAKASSTWPEVLPGADLALWSAKNPLEAARRKLADLRARGPLPNRLENGDFTVARGQQPESWERWQHETESSGQFNRDPEVGASGAGSGRLTGMQHGCFLQSVPAEPGQRFLLSAKVRRVGSGSPWITVRWQTRDGKWTEESRDVKFYAPTSADAAAWQEIVGRVTVPEGAGRLAVLAGVNGQRNPHDQVWFDDLVLVED